MCEKLREWRIYGVKYLEGEHVWFKNGGLKTYDWKVVGEKVWFKKWRVLKNEDTANLLHPF